MQSEAIIFRASPDFVAMLEHLARRDGVSKSEVIRRAVAERADSGCQQHGCADVDGETDPATLNPHTYLRDAACGSLEAQRALRSLGLGLAVEGDIQGAFDALMFARLADAHGDLSDAGALLSLLAICSDMLGKDERSMKDALAGETIAILDRLADTDHDSEAIARAVDEALIQVSVLASPEVMETGRVLRGMMKAAG